MTSATITGTGLERGRNMLISAIIRIVVRLLRSN
jgi:hypothetical protein